MPTTSDLLLVGTPWKRISTEIRNLNAHDGVREESFCPRAGTGASAMPHKRNPCRKRAVERDWQARAAQLTPWPPMENVGPSARGGDISATSSSGANDAPDLFVTSTSCCARCRVIRGTGRLSGQHCSANLNDCMAGVVYQVKQGAA